MPFLYGIRNHAVANEIELSLDHPAQCARKLIDGSADIGLIPVAAIKSVKHPHQITSWCIGSVGPVRSVALFSKVPLEEITEVLLDFQSVTSNMLVRILAAEFWKVSPLFIQASQGYENSIKGTTAAVIIGDRALKHYNTYPYRYDLAGEWNKFTGLPFVFARWVANRELEPGFIDRFDEALSSGIRKTDEMLQKNFIRDPDYPVIREYLTRNLDYRFDDLKKKGLEKFLALADQLRNEEISLQP